MDQVSTYWFVISKDRKLFWFVAGHLTPTRTYLINQSDNSNKTSCLVVSYFGAMGLTLVWNLPADDKHLAVEVRSGPVSCLTDRHSLYKLRKPHQTLTKQKSSIHFPENVWELFP